MKIFYEENDITGNCYTPCPYDEDGRVKIGSSTCRSCYFNIETNDIRKYVECYNIRGEYKLKNLRPAVERDIFVGNIVYILGDSFEFYRKTIEDVLEPSDPYKAFCADDGCRYGLEDCFVQK